MSRRELREQIFKLLFRIEFNPREEMEAQTELFFEEEENQADVADTAYITEKFNRILDRLEQIDRGAQRESQGLGYRPYGQGGSGYFAACRVRGSL